MPGMLQAMFGSTIRIAQQESATALLLDTYINAAAAYSLRLLRTAHTVTDSDATSATFNQTDTYVIQVRESGTNSIKSFTADEITDGTLLSFVGSNNGLITKWYDQSGNGNHLYQTTAANQPIIVSSGVIEVTVDGQSKPCVSFNGHFLIGDDDSSLNFTGAHNFFVNFEQISQANNRQIFFAKGRTATNATFVGQSPYYITYVGSGAGIDYQYRLSEYSGADYRVALAFGTAVNNQINLFTCRWDGTTNANSLQARVDSTLNAQDQMTKTAIESRSELFCMGSDYDRLLGLDTIRQLQARVNEVIIYPYDNDSNISSIETDIINYYH